MAKAHITTKNGTKITIEGTPEEIIAMTARFDGSTAVAAKRASKAPARTSGAKAGPVGLVSELIDGGFFKKPKELSAIKTALEEQGHFYPITSLSGVLLRLVRKRDLRRIKDKKRWLYVG
jgi:hypothetical protein